MRRPTYEDLREEEDPGCLARERLERGCPEMFSALREIARGRPDCGRPLGGEVARQIARRTLLGIGEDWR